jgi:hypothetical protein
MCTCAVSPAQNSPFGFPQIDRRTGSLSVRQKIKGTGIRTQRVDKQVVLYFIDVQKIDFPSKHPVVSDVFDYRMSPVVQVQQCGKTKGDRKTHLSAAS